MKSCCPSFQTLPFFTYSLMLGTRKGLRSWRNGETRPGFIPLTLWDLHSFSSFGAKVKYLHLRIRWGKIEVKDLRLAAGSPKILAIFLQFLSPLERAAALAWAEPEDQIASSSPDISLIEVPVSQGTRIYQVFGVWSPTAWGLNPSFIGGGFLRCVFVCLFVCLLVCFGLP